MHSVAMLRDLVTRICAFLLIASCAVPAAGQEEPDTGALLGELRKPATGARRRDQIVEVLMGAGVNGRYQLYVHAHNRFRRMHRDFAKHRRSHLEAFEKGAPRALAKKQGDRRQALAEIGELRDKALAVTRGKDLSKERIQEIMDPAVRRLEELLQVSAAEVLELEKSLGEDAGELAAEHRELLAWFQIHEESAQGLYDNPRHRARILRDGEVPDPVHEIAEVEVRRRLLAAWATPMSVGDRKVLERDEVAFEGLDGQEVAGTRELNRIRLLLGLGAVAVDLKLSAAARGHAEDMRRLGFFSHTSPVPGKESPGKRAALAGTSGSAENIAWGTGTGRGAIRMWWYSPGHHKNMLGGHRRVGLGRSESHWTQMFGG